MASPNHRTAFMEFAFQSIYNSMPYTCKNAQIVIDLQRQVATSVSIKSISGCVRTACSQLFSDKSGTSCQHLVTRLTTVPEFLKVVPTSLISPARNNLLLVTKKKQYPDANNYTIY